MKREWIETKRNLPFQYAGNLMRLPKGRSYADTIWPELDRETAVLAMRHAHKTYHWVLQADGTRAALTTTGVEYVPDELTAPVVLAAPDPEEVTVEIPPEPEPPEPEAPKAKPTKASKPKAKKGKK